MLLRLLKNSSAVADDASLKLRVSYEDRRGIPDFSQISVQPCLPDASADNSSPFFENNGVRKAVLLARYASVLKQWMIDERQPEPEANDACGAASRAFHPPLRGQGIFANASKRSLAADCEQAHVALKVSAQYKAVFEKMLQHLCSEMHSLGDDSLEQECTLMKKLIALAGKC